MLSGLRQKRILENSCMAKRKDAIQDLLWVVSKLEVPNSLKCASIIL
jgi:hypothetical protein